MRLTLRTLLAYLDNILEPADAEMLRRKIEESDFAKGLVHRIESASTRKRLGAPNVLGRGMGLDANTVAQYLDSTLPPDRVPDLERICLESDIHLAEVASCHQILAIVLAEAVEVDPHLRDHIYRLGAPNIDRVADTAVPPGEQYAIPPAPPLTGESSGSSSEGHVASVPPAPPVSGLDRGSTIRPAGKSKSPIPEYLRAGQRPMWKPLAITLVLAFMLSAIVLRVMGPFNGQHPILRLFGAGTDRQVAGGPGPNRPDEVEGLGSNGDGSDSTRNVASEDQPDVGETQAIHPGTTTEAGSGESGVGRGTGESADPDANGVSGTMTETPGTVSTPAQDPAATVDDGPGVEFPETKPAIPPGASSDVEATDTAITAAEKTAVGTPPVLPIEVGFVKIRDLHFPLRLEPATNDWQRLEARTKLMSGDRLQILPTYQPEIVLAPGVQVVFAGPSSVQLQAPTAEGEPSISMEYGRAFIATAGVPGARLHLSLGDRRCVVTFVDAASELALEVRRFLPLGANPEQGMTQHVVRMFTTIGQIEWQDTEQSPPVRVIQGQSRVLIDSKSETIAAAEVPPWILREDLREIDRGASVTLESYLVMDRPITLSLKERIQDRRMEIRALAALCLSYLGSFEGLVQELNDPRQRSYWAAEFEALRDAISRSPEEAAQVHMILGTLYPNVADQSYRLLAGYSANQLQEGADAFLVESLESDSLPLRILAFENLRRITDLTLLYRPYVTDELRKSSVRGWRERLANQGIVYDTLPSPTSGRW